MNRPSYHAEDGEPVDGPVLYVAVMLAALAVLVGTIAATILAMLGCLGG